MKSASKAKAGRREVEINLLARRVVSNNYSRERVLREINMIYSGTIGIDRDKVLVQVMRRCYETVCESESRSQSGVLKRMLLNEREYFAEEQLHECFAVRLCGFLIEKIQGSSVSCTSDYLFSRNFYSFCVRELIDKGYSGDEHDAELVEIYVKQALIMLRQAGILVSEKGKARITDRVFSGNSLFMLIFSSFWNSVKWEDIFPSNAAAARDLKKSRHILIDVILKYQTGFLVDEAANNFFDLTGFARTNDLKIISFLDFYFFTWMNHFGLLLYDNTDTRDAVRVCLTERGRKFLKGLQNIH